MYTVAGAGAVEPLLALHAARIGNSQEAEPVPNPLSGRGGAAVGEGQSARRQRLAARLVVISNRLPVIAEQVDEKLQIRSASGGLVTALNPILRRVGGMWIGWAGAPQADPAQLQDKLREFGTTAGYTLETVPMSQAEIEGFYQGFSNEIIWPLFHDLQSFCNFAPEYWTRYLSVKEKFAEVVREKSGPGDFLWVQDYQLMGLGRKLREGALQNRLGFFLHIPFPPPDIFFKLPWRSDVLESLLFYHVIGFQTPRDRENFLDCVRALLPEARFRRGLSVVDVQYQGRRTRIGVYPIGIDFREFSGGAASEAVTQLAASLRKELGSPQIILSVDRLDYTKGIPYRLRAFQLALSRYPELHRAVTLLQVVVPSREAVQQYQDLKSEIERMVTRINGEFTQPGWVPIHHVFRSLSREELVAYYRAADVALVTPLKDGMNLVCKEYCASQLEGNGVLVLSEFAGAAVQFRKDALLVNPFDFDRVAETIRHAVSTTPAQRRPRMRRLKGNVRREDVYWWLDRFLDACDVQIGAGAAGEAKS